MLNSTTNDGMVMPVTPMNNGGGFGGYGDNGIWWILLLFIILGGWGNGGYGGYGPGNGGGTVEINNDIQRGFDQQATTSTLAGINSALSDGFANAEVARCNMTQNLSNQLSGIAAGQIQNSCNNQLATESLRATVLQENCQDRYEVSQNTRDIIQSQNEGVQRIMDQMAQDKLDAKNEQIANLRQELAMANLAQSQSAQTATLLADNALQTTALEQYLNPVPVPAYVVPAPYGCNCNSNYCCGCGM